MANVLEKFAQQIDTLAAHETVRDVEWVVPAVQTVHIIAVAVVFSGSLLIALRAFGVAGTDWTMARWQQRIGGWTAGALLLLLLSGAVLILAEPERELLNSLFQIKMPLVIVAALLSWFLARKIAAAPPRRPLSGAMMLVALVVMLIWVVVMGLGRWIAYAGS